jgi:hypothetical protein
MQVQQMISTHPDARGSTNDALIRCIEECYSCAQTCTSCGDACLAQDMASPPRWRCMPVMSPWGRPLDLGHARAVHLEVVRGASASNQPQ